MKTKTFIILLKLKLLGSLWNNKNTGVRIFGGCAYVETLLASNTLEKSPDYHSSRSLSL
jgi:hypothetical protein